jgi:hypothetical protein
MAFDLKNIQVPDSIKGRIRAGTQSKIDQITRSFDALPAKYQKLIEARGASTKLGLTGLGNYVTGDNPNTPEIETDAIYRADNRIGERETAAVKSADNAANARGMMFSSFRDKSVGDALGRLSREANQVLTQYATDLTKLEGDKLGEQEGMYNALQTLYGDEVDYLKENPPPPPATPDAPAGGGGDAGGGSGGGAAASSGGQRVWIGAAKPNLKALQKKHPNMNLRVVFVNPRSAGSSGAHYSVIATPK